MRNTRDKDLWLICLLTIILVAVIGLFPDESVVRVVLGIPMILFFPGYVLIAALFPRKSSLGGIERVALSFGLSIAMVPLIGLILNYTPWGIRLYPILVSLTAFIVILSGVAWRRRKGVAENERFVVPFSGRIKLSSWQGQGRWDKVLSVVLVAAIIGAIGTLVYVVTSPKVGEQFTEFYILGMEGKAEHYPEALYVGEEGKVILGIVNHEGEQTNYRVKLEMDGEEAGLVVGGEAKDTLLVTLAHEEKWEGEVGFIPRKAGDEQKVEFLLYKEGEAEPYLKLHIWLNVEQE